MNTRNFIAAIVFLCASVSAFAAAPANYYAAIEGKSDNALRLALQDIIDGHTVVSYDDLKTLFKYSDTKETVASAGTYLIDIYSECQYVPGSAFTKDSECGGGYNREHSVPKSWFNEASPMYSDAFHLYPTSAYVNSYRGNYPFGECASGTKCTTHGVPSLGRRGNCTYAGYSGVVYEPDDIYKGDLARTYFYMATRYADKCSSWTGDMFGSNNNGFRTWAINMLLEWHRTDPVSEKEIIRNEAIYGNPTYNKGAYKQNNRNPFIDYPDLAEYIWGNKKGQTFSFSGDGDDEEQDCTAIDYAALYTSQNDFTTFSAVGDHTWRYDTSYGMKMSGYISATKTHDANEDWLISPAFNLLGQKNVTIAFEHALNFATNSNISDQFTLWVSNNYNGNVTTATWTKLTIPTYPSGNDYDFVSVKNIVIPTELCTANTHFAFKYISTTTESATWEIKKLNVTSECMPMTTLAPRESQKPLVTIEGRNLQSLNGEIVVYNTIGQRVGEGQQVQISQAGVYIVRSGLQTQKVFVK